MLKVYIGFDPKEAVAFHVLSDSIMRLSSGPVCIVPLITEQLIKSKVYLREYDRRQSNAFSFTRFLVPHLSDYKGKSIFMDCDMLLRGDIYQVLEEIDENAAVSVVKHDYVSSVKTKYLGTKQYSYPRKNWSSFVVWNCAHEKNRQVNPEFVKSQDAATLHRFLWLHDDEIGSLDLKWNWLVGEYTNPPKNVMNLHWTLGGPYFNEYRNTEFAEEWFKQRTLTNHCDQITDI